MTAGAALFPVAACQAGAPTVTTVAATATVAGDPTGQPAATLAGSISWACSV